MAPDIISGLVELTNTIMKELPSILETLLPTVINGGMSIIKELLSTILNMLPQILEMGITILLELVNGIVEAIPNLIPTIVSVIKKIVEILMAHIDEILVAGIDILLAIIDGIIEALPDLIDMLPMIISQIVVTLTSPNNLMKLIAAGIQILVAVIKGILQTIPQLLLLPANIFLDIVNKFKEQFSKVKDVGKNLINGLWNGIKEKWEGLKNKVADFGKGIVNKFKSVFGIKSPSKVMRDQIGKNLADGIGVGFEDQIDGVYRDMQRAIDYEQSKLNANVESGNIFNSIQNSTPVAIEINADVEMDSQKVGRLVTPAVTRTIKNGGGI
jgi:phage-related protein